MTEQEAINVFKGFKFTPREMKAVAMGIEALEKQIPKEPLDFGDESYLCPYCKRNNFYKGEYLDKQNYCDYCGQRIDWREENDSWRVDKYIT